MSDTGLGQRTPTELLDVMREARRTERIATAGRLLAAGRLCQLRVTGTDTDPRSFWCVDDWESVAAEIGAELGISRQRASWEMHYGTVLLERLPKLGAAFAAGHIDFRIIATIISRTALIIDPDVLARIDTQLATLAPRWNQRADKKIIDHVDRIVVDLDPDAIRIARQADHDRHIDIDPTGNGMTDIYGSVPGPDAEIFTRRLDELAATVCPADPRTKAQRRADALRPLSNGATTIACQCGTPDCPANTEAATGTATDTGTGTGRSDIVLHVIADTAAIAGDTDAAPGLSTRLRHPARPQDRRPRRTRHHPPDHPPQRQPTRTALPPLPSIGRLRPRPRPDVSVPGLPGTGLALRYRPHRAPPARAHPRIQPQLQMPASPSSESAP